MNLTAPYKLLVMVVTIICLTVLMAVGTLDTAAGMTPITAMVFYVIGNGTSALKGKPSEPIIGPSDAQVAKRDATSAD